MFLRSISQNSFVVSKYLFYLRNYKTENTMKEIGGIKLYDFEEILDEDYGPIGTPKRDEFERRVDESVRAYKLRVEKANTDNIDK